jgi:hypothetical protein
MINQLLESSHKRVPWQIMLTILKRCDLPSGHGWKNTKEKLTNLSNTDFSVNTPKFNKLKDLYCDYLLTGSKSVKLFKVDNERISKIIDLFSYYKIEDNIFHETYPFILEDESLLNVDSHPKLVDIKDSKSSLVIVFCTKRSFTERGEIDINQLDSPEAKQELMLYDEIYGVRKYDRQFLDAIVLWKNRGLLEIRIDIGNGMSVDERKRAFIQIEKNFKSFVESNIGINDLLNEKVNLFPLISRLYQSSEGKVGELAFTTEEGSTKREKMRRGSMDLRAETYHTAGMKAVVNQITPFRLAIIWQFPDLNTQPELFLPATVQSLSSITQELHEVIIRKCGGLEDYNFVFEKIITFLER